jgi:hypothetical protein
MIGKKLILLKNGKTLIQNEVPFEVPYIKDIRHLTIENIKKYEHMALVAVVKSYIQFSNFLKSKYQELKNQIIRRTKKSHIIEEKQEVSKFLKMISDYQHKIREIKHKIKEEEKDL